MTMETFLKIFNSFKNIVGGLLFLLGSVLDGVAQNLAMLLLGRIVLGAGLGFTNQVSHYYLFLFLLYMLYADDDF